MLIFGGVNGFHDFTTRTSGNIETTNAQQHYFGFRLTTDDKFTVYRVSGERSVSHTNLSTIGSRSALDCPPAPRMSFETSSHDRHRHTALIFNFNLGNNSKGDAGFMIDHRINSIESVTGDIDFTDDPAKIAEQIRKSNIGEKTFYSLKGKDEPLRITDDAIENLANNIAAYKKALTISEIRELEDVRYSIDKDVQKITRYMRKIGAVSNAERGAAIANQAIANFKQQKHNRI